MQTVKQLPFGLQDSEYLAKDKRVQALEEYNQKAQKAVEGLLAHQELIGDWHTSGANPERQQGRAMGWKELANELKVLNPKIQVIPHPVDPTKVAFYYTANFPPYVHDPVTNKWGGVQQRFVCAGETHMPEWSLYSTKEQTLPHNTRDAGAPLKTETVPWSEEKRGWRTVLALLLMGRLLTVPQVEGLVKKYGSTQESKSWADRLYGGTIHAKS